MRNANSLPHLSPPESGWGRWRPTACFNSSPGGPPDAQGVEGCDMPRGIYGCQVFVPFIVGRRELVERTRSHCQWPWRHCYITTLPPHPGCFLHPESKLQGSACQEATCPALCGLSAHARHCFSIITGFTCLPPAHWSQFRLLQLQRLSMLGPVTATHRGGGGVGRWACRAPR